MNTPSCFDKLSMRALMFDLILSLSREEAGDAVYDQ